MIRLFARLRPDDDGDDASRARSLRVRMAVFVVLATLVFAMIWLWPRLHPERCLEDGTFAASTCGAVPSFDGGDLVEPAASALERVAQAFQWHGVSAALYERQARRNPNDGGLYDGFAWQSWLQADRFEKADAAFERFLARQLAVAPNVDRATPTRDEEEAQWRARYLTYRAMHLTALERSDEALAALEQAEAHLLATPASTGRVSLTLEIASTHRDLGRRAAAAPLVDDAAAMALALVDNLEDASANRSAFGADFDRHQANVMLAWALIERIRLAKDDGEPPAPDDVAQARAALDALADLPTFGDQLLHLSAQLHSLIDEAD